MTTEKAGCPRMGRMATRSIIQPVMAMAARAEGTPTQYGQPSQLTSPRPQKAPSIIRSPWAKLTVSVAL